MVQTLLRVSSPYSAALAVPLDPQEGRGVASYRNKTVPLV
jgi:hypothetical protein